MLGKIVVFLAIAGVVFGNSISGDVQRKGRIVGGAGVNLGLVPSMASLRSLLNVHYCGGTILTLRYIVTAGTCVAGRGQTDINTVVGSVTLNAGGVTHRSQNHTTHPLFDRVTLNYDVALIFVATNIAFTANVQTVAISPTITAGAISAQVSGWGSNLQTGGAVQNNLQRLQTNTITNAECRERVFPNQAAFVTDNKLCSLTTINQGNCFGDEGSGLIVGGQLVAIVSWHSPCATGRPDVYERLTSSRLWIQSITG